MEAKIEGSSKFFQEVELTNVLTLRCSHIMFFLCWLGLLLSGTTIVGYGASNFLLEQPHCPTSDDFCTYSLTLDADRSLYFYIKVYPVYQNNRLYPKHYPVTSTPLATNNSMARMGLAMSADLLTPPTTNWGYNILLVATEC